VRKQADVHPATNAIRKLVESGAARSSCDARAAEKGLPKWIDLRRVAQSEAGAEEIGVGVQGNPARRSMVTAEIAHDAEPTPAFEIIGEGAADAVLIDAAGASQAEVGVADRGIKGLGV